MPVWFYASLRGACFQNRKKFGQMKKLERYLCAFQAFACNHGQPNAEVAESAQQFGCSGKGGGSQVCVQLAVVVDK